MLVVSMGTCNIFKRAIAQIHWDIYIVFVSVYYQATCLQTGVQHP